MLSGAPGVRHGLAQEFRHLGPLIFPFSHADLPSSSSSSFLLFRATPARYGSSQARSQIGAPAAGLRHSHSNSGSEPHSSLAMLDPRLTEQGQGSNPHPHGS